MRKRKYIAKAVMRNKAPSLAMFAIFAVALISIMNLQNKRLNVDSTTYTPLLNLIASAESKGNYNAYFGNANNSSIDFTAMSVAEVMEWQQEYVAKGSASSAVGRYQIIDSTLAGLVREMKIDTSQPFDEAMQDKMAVKLLERRGSVAYVNEELTRHEFAANLAKEWAALPKVVGENPDESYYASDGLNKSLVTTDEVLGAIEPISPKK